MASDRLLVGRVRGAHGLRGALRVEVITDRPKDRFTPGQRLYAQERPLTIEESSQTKDGYLLRFTEVGDRDAAGELRGSELSVDRDDVVVAPGEFLHSDLLGLTVVTASGEFVGEIIDVFNTGANDIYEVSANDKTILIPATDEVIDLIDIEKKRLVINPIEGLLE